MWIALLTACTFTKTRIHVDDHFPSGSVAGMLADPVYWTDLEPDGDPFHDNTALGNLTFTGGYVTESTGSGLFNVSKNVELDAGSYRKHADTWLQNLLVPGAEVTPPLPDRVERRGTYRRDGHDNVSLPRAKLIPGPLAEAPGKAVTVPLVVSYYSHNAGWFFGQEYGTAAGARIRVLLVSYDAEGSVVGWIDVDGSNLSERVFSPTGPQLQDLLIVLEKRVGRRLTKAL